ncbi:MAG: hypothetical protein WC874_00680 [Candidatus Izemoplasmatales bacterium]|jgi:hypothetical protein
MKRMTVLFSIIALLLTIASFLLIGFTLGWFAPSVIITTNEVAVGDLRYSLSGEFITSNPLDPTVIVPGDELLTSTIGITNNSPIESQLRIKIEYTAYHNNEGEITGSTETYGAAVGEPLVAVFAFDDNDTPDNYTDDINFIYSDNWWYWDNTDYVYSINSGSQEIITSIFYDGNYTGIDYSSFDVSHPVTVSITIEVKQADNVTWSGLTTFIFTTQTTK